MLLGLEVAAHVHHFGATQLAHLAVVFEGLPQPAVLLLSEAARDGFVVRDLEIRQTREL